MSPIPDCLGALICTGDYREQLQEELTLIDSLPEDLQIDLPEEARGSVFRCNQMFSEIHSTQRSLLRELVHKCVSDKIAVAGEVLFDFGFACNRVLFLDTGAPSARAGACAFVSEFRWGR